jgi:hypothetical protein
MTSSNTSINNFKLYFSELRKEFIYLTKRRKDEILSVLSSLKEKSQQLCDDIGCVTNYDIDTKFAIKSILSQFCLLLDLIQEVSINYFHHSCSNYLTIGDKHES